MKGNGYKTYLIAGLSALVMALGGLVVSHNTGSIQNNADRIERTVRRLDSIDSRFLEISVDLAVIRSESADLKRRVEALERANRK